MSYTPRPLGAHLRDLREVADMSDDVAEAMHLDGVYDPVLLDAEVKVRAAWALLTEAVTMIRHAPRKVVDVELPGCPDCGGSGRVRMDDGAYVQCVCQCPPLLRDAPW